MERENAFLYPRYEEHATLFCDGISLHSDGFVSGPDKLPLPAFYEAGLCAIYHLLERMLPGLQGISVHGIWWDDESAPFCAWDLWLLIGEDDGFYLPMSSTASLFSQNGIPYFHRPLL